MELEMHRSCSLARILALAGACLAGSAGSAEVPKLDTPPGRYTLDKNHASLVFRIMHQGLSNYTARFTRFDAAIELDPARIENSKVTATIDPHSVETDYPGPAEFDKEIATKPEFLDGNKHPRMQFVSRSIRAREDGTLEVTGDFSMHGATHPVMLNVKLNGARPHAMTKVPTLGISARGNLKRSEWGVTGYLPFIAADAVAIEIEAEFKRDEAR
jgi:polyisoprenoid-binding protein YceI